MVTAGPRGDAPHAGALRAGFKPGAVGHVVAAAADSDAIRAFVRRLGARACIRPNSTRKRVTCDRRSRYKNRDVIEWFFGRINATGGWRRGPGRKRPTTPASSGSPPG
ncbi:hypothetical protein [Limnoglobus roseus]|uniref:hypothetical protein n=1 Tax=Limnoglobus roseus TaxID=2598579 RepID=UPI0011EB73E7